MASLGAAHRQFIVFVAGGVLSACVDVGLLQLLSQAGLPAAAAVTVGFGAGLLVNYLFHARVTFRRAPQVGNMLRYLCTVGINYLLTLACVALAVHTGHSVLAGKLVSLPLVAGNGFMLSKYWIFR